MVLDEIEAKYIFSGKLRCEREKYDKCRLFYSSFYEFCRECDPTKVKWIEWATDRNVLENIVREMPRSYDEKISKKRLKHSQSWKELQPTNRGCLDPMILADPLKAFCSSYHVPQPTSKAAASVFLFAFTVLIIAACLAVAVFLQVHFDALSASVTRYYACQSG